MATEYDLCIANDIDSDSLLRIVEDALGLDHFRDPECRSEHNPSLVGRWAPGLLLTAHAVRPMSAEIAEEWLGFRPNISLGFRLDTMQDDQYSVYHDMLRATSAVLERVPGDAALTMISDGAYLIRRGDHVIVHDEPGTYWAHALSELRVPYELGRIPTAADAP